MMSPSGDAFVDNTPCCFIGSPFKVPIEDVVDPSKVRLYGPGLKPEGVRATEPASFTVDCRDAGKAPLNVTMDDGEYGYNYGCVFTGILEKRGWETGSLTLTVTMFVTIFITTFVVLCDQFCDYNCHCNFD